MRRFLHSSSQPCPSPVRPERPRGRSWSLGWGFPGLGWADWTPPPPVHRLSSLRPSWSTEGIHTNLFIESAAPTWLCHLPVRPSVRLSVHPALLTSAGSQSIPLLASIAGGATPPMGPTHCEGWVFGEQLPPSSRQLGTGHHHPWGDPCAVRLSREAPPSPLAASPADLSRDTPVPALGLVGRRASRKTSEPGTPCPAPGGRAAPPPGSTVLGTSAGGPWPPPGPRVLGGGLSPPVPAM